MNKKPTSVDVAKLAGVSQASVSRAFAIGGSISTEKKSKILKAAQQLNYIPNEMARILNSKYSNCIAIIQPISNNPYFYALILDKLLTLLNSNNQRVVIFNQTSINQNIDEILPLIAQYQVDGVIVSSANIDAKTINQYSNKGIEFSFINRHVPNVYASSICTNNKASSASIVKYLADKGCTRFICFAGDSKASTSISRVDGYKEKIQGLNLIDEGIFYSELNERGGYETFKKLFSKGINLPDVIVCGNDEIAIGVINAIKDLTNLKIPDDILVTGFDDIIPANWSPYQITTIKQPIDELCKITVDDLIRRIKDRTIKPTDYILDGQLIVRGSA